jgi:hypothetical protein
MKAIKVAFPRAANMLCGWHLDKNMEASLFWKSKWSGDISIRLDEVDKLSWWIVIWWSLASVWGSK